MTLPLVSPRLHRLLQPGRQLRIEVRACDEPCHAEQHIPAALAQRGGTRAGTVGDEGKPRTKKQAAKRLGGKPGRLQVEVHLGETVQNEDTDHADKNGGHHDLHDREVLQEELAQQHIVFSHTALLQQETKREAEENGGEQFRQRKRPLRGGLHFFDRLAGINHNQVKSAMAVAMPPMNMAMTVSQEPALS